MKFYFAPMEGVTGYIYRNIHHQFFPFIDKYFTPFISPNQNKCFNSRELNDVMPDHNMGMMVVPQILTNQADYFIHTSNELKRMGYDEVNLNLGCPSGTVVAKHKGSGFLSQTEALSFFLDRIFSQLDIKISIKTRIGKDSPDEFYDLLRIFNQFPLEELIIHPRIQKDYYKNKPNWNVFKEAWKESKNPVCYNGNIFSIFDYEEFIKEFPEVDCVMLGRGLLANPGLVDCIREHKLLTKQVIIEFHNMIYQRYQENLSGDKTILFKMKELCFYMTKIFTSPETYMKKIKKAQRLLDYESAIFSLFEEQEIVINHRIKF